MKRYGIIYVIIFESLTGVMFMLGRIQRIDNTVLDNIGKIHKPLLNKIMITVSRSGNLGIVWWAICLMFIMRPMWKATGYNFILGLSLAHVMGEMIIMHKSDTGRAYHAAIIVNIKDGKYYINHAVRTNYYKNVELKTASKLAFYRYKGC